MRSTLWGSGFCLNYSLSSITAALQKWCTQWGRKRAFVIIITTCHGWRSALKTCWKYGWHFSGSSFLSVQKKHRKNKACRGRYVNEESMILVSENADSLRSSAPVWETEQSKVSEEPLPVVYLRSLSSDGAGRGCRVRPVRGEGAHRHCWSCWCENSNPPPSTLPDCVKCQLSHCGVRAPQALVHSRTITTRAHALARWCRRCFT